MNPLARLARRGQRPAEVSPERLGGADGGPGALSTLELEPGPAPPGVDDDRPAGRFVVVPTEWTGSAAARSARSKPNPGARSSGSSGPTSALVVDAPASPWRLLGRLVLVVVVSLVAFHHSVGSVLDGIEGGSIIVYVLAVPLYGGVAAAAINRRPGYRIASGVRLTDLLLGAASCLVALGVAALLGPGLSGVYGLWRVDLLMLWLFLLGGTVLCFGLRQVVRSWPFWAVLLLLWPFPVRLANAAMSGANGGAALLLLVVLAAVAYGHRPEDAPRWKVLGSAAAAGTLVLVLAGLTTHPQRLFWPSAAAAIVGVAWWVVQGHPTPRTPVPERRVRGTAVVIAGLGIVGLVALPPAPRSLPPVAPTGITVLPLGPLVVPGFATTATVTSKDQQRYFGLTSTWQRISLRQGDPRTGPAPDGRDVVVDVISTPRPQSLELYPVVTTYPMGTLSSTPDAYVELGHGVTGQVFRAEDVRHHIAYTLLTFSWRLPVDMSITGGYTGPPAQLNQRITLIAVDDHGDDARFPEPGDASLDGIRAAIASVGVPRKVREESSLRPDEQLLAVAARGLVNQRLTGG